MRWATGVTVFLLLLAAGAGVIFVVSRMPQKPIVLPAPPPEAAPVLPPPAVGAQWRYTAPRAYTAAEAGVEACTKSLADIAIGGGVQSNVRLCLRRGGGYPFAGSIVLGDPQGHLACADCQVRASFDGRAAQTFSATAASTDGTDYSLFIRDGAQLAAELKRSSTATFDVPVRGSGAEEVRFNVAGLKWE
jgi:hypothetical protein